MERVYKPLGLDNVELCHPVQQDDFETLNARINGTPQGDTWRPVPMRLIHEDEGRQLTRSDAPWLGSHALIFRASVIQKLGEKLAECGELLPLACDEAELWVYNPLRVIDALDEDASSVARLSNGRICLITKHVFRQERLVDVDVFKITSLRVSPTFVGERFTQLWRSSGLIGLDFQQVWAPN